MKKSVISAIVMIFAAPAFALGPGAEFKSYDRERVELGAFATYYQAQGNFTSSGNSFDSLPSGYSFENIQFDVDARSHLFAKWAGFAKVTIGNTTSKTPLITRTNSSLSSALVGLDFIMSEGSFVLIPEFSASFALSKNTYTSDVAAVGDGANTLGARLILNSTLSKSLSIGAHGGFLYRDEGLSSLIPYGGLVEWKGKSLALGADIRGYASVGYDKESDNEIPRNAYQCTANGCAKRFAAINPSLTESNLWLKWQKESWIISGGLGTAITGQNTSTGIQAHVGLEYQFRTRAAEVETDPDPKQRVTNPNFQESVDDGVDQTLFEPPRPAAPPAPPPPPKPVKATPRQEEVIKNELEKTEMQIELKSNKKPKKKKTR